MDFVEAEVEAMVEVVNQTQPKQIMTLKITLEVKDTNQILLGTHAKLIGFMLTKPGHVSHLLRAP